MLSIIKAELFKLFKGKTIKILMFFSLVISLLFVFVPMSLEKVTGPAVPYNLFFTSLGTPLLSMFVAIIASENVSNEYSEGTKKNTLAYGIKRKDLYLARFVTNVIAITICTAITSILLVVIFTILKGWRQPFEIAQIMNMAKAFLGTIVLSSAMLAVIMIISTLVKSNGSTISISIAVYLILALVLQQFAGFNKIVAVLYQLSVSCNLGIVASSDAPSSAFVKAIIIGLVWIVVALAVGISTFKKQEIK